MRAELASNRKPRFAIIDPADVRSLTGYMKGTRTKVTLVTGRVLHLGHPVDEVRAALEAESRDILRRGLERVQRERAQYEAEHPEWADYFDLLEAMGNVLAAASKELADE